MSVAADDGDALYKKKEGEFADVAVFLASKKWKGKGLMTHRCVKDAKLKQWLKGYRRERELRILMLQSDHNFFFKNQVMIELAFTVNPVL